MAHTYPTTTYSPTRLSEKDIVDRAKHFYHHMDNRRTVRDFSPDPIPFEVIAAIVRTASTAPSGAHKQPWTFCVVSNADLKEQIRIGAEKEEYENYHGRMPAEWLEDLAPFGTDWHKPFLEVAPYLIVVFKQAYELDALGNKRKNYYVEESVGIACGFLLAALHNAGLAALTHTPSPMNFLSTLLGRPVNERPFLLIPVGLPLPQYQVPELARKTVEQVLIHYP